MNEEIRDCERYCPKCERWKHHSRFASRKRAKRIGLAPTIHFDPLCRDCQQIVRNERKNRDRPREILKRRAAVHAKNLGVPVSFLWLNMNWRALVPVLRVMLTPEGRCLDCGHEFRSERDVQIEHREPPRHAKDWARQHTRNLGLGCQSCNGTKGTKSFASWLDEQEEARLANEKHREAEEPGSQVPVQLELEMS